jgi:hypothetical protein
MSGAPTRAHVTLERRRLWSLRASLAAARWLVYAAALAGVVATVRNALAPAAVSGPRAAASSGPSDPDAAAEWFALRFARAYLAWSGDPALHEGALAPFLEAGDDPGAGLAPAPRTAEGVSWEAIAAAGAGAGGAHDYTVAVATTGGSIRYLAVAVGSTGAGETLLRYPALVAAPVPAPAPSLDGAGLPPLVDPQVAEVLYRALRNYIGASSDNLAADLAPGARVEAIPAGLSLRSIDRLAVAGPHDVLATVVASDRLGTTYTLAYQLSLTQIGGRWEITRIES